MNMRFNDEKIENNVIFYRHLIKHLLILVLQGFFKLYVLIFLDIKYKWKLWDSH